MLATTLVRKTRIFFVQCWITPDEQQSIIEFDVAHHPGMNEWVERNGVEFVPQTGESSSSPAGRNYLNLMQQHLLNYVTCIRFILFAASLDSQLQSIPIFTSEIKSESIYTHISDVTLNRSPHPHGYYSMYA
jgi:hypothetical protein